MHHKANAKNAEQLFLHHSSFRRRHFAEVRALMRRFWLRLR
ncbi:hypothetical protein PJE062_3792 [Pseudovibrio sp. JE062]|nr:hypothetical protein PJE062_3792 [Pseudovibrio sp. JE062]